MAKKRKSPTGLPKGRKTSKKAKITNDEPTEDPAQEQDIPEKDASHAEPGLDAQGEGEDAGTATTSNQAGPMTLSQPNAIQREALAKSNSLYTRYFNEARLKKAWSQFVKVDELFDAEHVLVPIAAVTEAITYRTERGMRNHIFDITTVDNMDLAKQWAIDKRPGGEINLVKSIRPGRPLLVPWIFSKEDQIAITGQTRSTKEVSKANEKAAEKHEIHTFLLLISMNRGCCEIRVYDSYLLPFRQDRVLWPGLVKLVKDAVRSIEWFPESTPAMVVIPGTDDSRFGPEVEVQVAHQIGGWPCGIHTIINAWTVAMNLLPNPNFLREEQTRGKEGETSNSDIFYQSAVTLINLVVAGYADSDIIYAFLVGRGFALPSKSRNQCPSFGPLHTIHTIRDGGTLQDYVLRARERAEWDRAMRESLLETTLPNATAANATAPHGTLPTATNPNYSNKPAADLQNPNGGPATQAQNGQRPGTFNPRRQRMGKIEPNVIAHPLFAGADGNAFYESLRKEQPLRIDAEKLAGEESMKNFLNYVVDKIGNERQKGLPFEEKKTWFENHKRQFEAALNCKPEDDDPLHAEHWNLLIEQLEIFRLLHEKEVVPMAKRRHLFQLYERVISGRETGKKQDAVAHNGPQSAEPPAAANDGARPADESRPGGLRGDEELPDDELEDSEGVNGIP